VGFDGMKSALLLFPHQLYKLDQLPEVDIVFLFEDPYYFGLDERCPLKLHKQKLVLHRASMRRYAKELLWPANIQTEYIELDPLKNLADVINKMSHYDKLYVFDPIDDFTVERLLAARRDSGNKPELELLDSPNFYLKDHEVRQYFSKAKQHLFTDFYQWQRERFNVLIGDDYKPVGGKWTFDGEDKQRLPKNHQLPTFQVFGDNEFVRDAVDWVEQHFADNLGSTDFIWPTSHEEAAKWLEDFAANRLDNFGPHQDSIDGQAAWVYHSALSSSLNIGLLSPSQVVEAALARHHQKPVPLPSLEGFVRQILGWREYVRGTYLAGGSSMRLQNKFKQSRYLTDEWYSGSTGILPLDDVVLKVHGHSYAHHIERLMIVGNLMMLCEIKPDEVHRWFSELFIDAYDWVTVPNIYGLSQYADGGSIATKPYISSSNYITSMSHYERGEWSDVWDGLYWRFIDKHKAVLSTNPQMRVLVQRLERLDPDRKRIIGYRAEDFLARFTRL
jgi:deoxyribodipyrimidine photolyase-related protein